MLKALNHQEEHAIKDAIVLKIIFIVDNDKSIKRQSEKKVFVAFKGVCVGSSIISFYYCLVYF